MSAFAVLTRPFASALRSSSRVAAVRPFSSSVSLRFASDSSSSYQNILTSQKGKVGIIQLNRPKALNALSSALFHEVNDALAMYDQDPTVGAIVLTGNEKAFAAGADIKEMKDNTFAGNYKTNFLNHWTYITQVQKPVIAAVNGYALGGGCELAMMCDIIYAGETAVFGQPEIKLGTLPGAGGSQRLTRAIGKSRAMELVLTGRNFSAKEASEWGLVSKVVPVGELVDEAVKLGDSISKFSLPVVQMCKEAVNKSYELSLREGLSFERRLFQASFSLDDQKEGMAAFAEKRKAAFKDQ